MTQQSSDDGNGRLRAGVIAGSIAAVAGSLANLPLEAPTDTLFNAATVTTASLAVVFAVVAATALALDGQVDRATSYVVPLAAIVLGIVGVATPLLGRALQNPPAWITAAALAVAVIVGAGLATQGDAESGTLTLPPRSSIIEVIATGVSK